MKFTRNANEKGNEESTVAEVCFTKRGQCNHTQSRQKEKKRRKISQKHGDSFTSRSLAARPSEIKSIEWLDSEPYLTESLDAPQPDRSQSLRRCLENL